MAILKCKMCGGELSFEEGSSVCECEYCGSKQTIPNTDDEKLAKLYDRANRLRFNNEFDKAYSVYESIIAESPEDAEAYWGLVLCKYGIEYVDDPATGDKVPTCHRSSFDSVMDDENFELVMENADSIARAVYREQAKAIEEIRKGIIEVSGKEEPYDIFICYKETAEDGQRTTDSVLAQDVYDTLTSKGYRVFFSRISLEDKLGTEYEPYIFAALNSAKVMLAFGTSYDYYNAVWVKNEWSRYLKLMAQDKEKHLIPCYKDIDAYDMPKEFKHLQAQDMGKVGAVQDLVRGIEKLLPKSESESTASVAPVTQIVGVAPNVDALLKRGFMSLEDRAWQKAEELFDEVLNLKPECAEAYLGLLMEKLGASNEKELHDNFIKNNAMNRKDYQRAKQFASDDQLAKFLSWEKEITDIKEAEERAEREKIEQHNAEINALWAERKKLKNEVSELYSDAEKELEECRTEYENLLEKKKSIGITKFKERMEIQKQIEEKQMMMYRMEHKVNEFHDHIDQKLKERVYEINEKLKLPVIKEVGDYVFMGHYKYRIGWAVLKIKGDKALLISENVPAEYKPDMLSRWGISSMYLEDDENGLTWENCRIRKWLNGAFVDEFFDENEKNIICETKVKYMVHEDKKNVPHFSSDRVFIMSSEETELLYSMLKDKDGFYKNNSFVSIINSFEYIPKGYILTMNPRTGEIEKNYDSKYNYICPVMWVEW